MIIKTYADEKTELKVSVRTSLRASSIDGSLSTIFSNITGGVLLSSFLIDLGASPFEIGMVASLPMLANLLQPLGAILSNRSQSRHDYGISIFLPARLLWLVLLVGIILRGTNTDLSRELVYLTLVLVITSQVLAAMGSASWMSWLAALVPAKLRGRYYSVRSIVSNVTGLLCLPIASFIIANWQGGSIAGYGLVLSIGILAGVASLTCQHLMIDINPQSYQTQTEPKHDQFNLFNNLIAPFQDRNLIFFLIYVAIWGFAVNISTPFFTLYMLENLDVDITWVTLLSSLSSGANMLMLLVWGKLSDRFGNRSLLIFAGMAIAITPLFWLLAGRSQSQELLQVPLQENLWLYLIIFHLFLGGSWAAIDLGSNNIQIEIAPIKHHATFFGIVSAIAGISSALGTTIGATLAQYGHYEGVFGVFFLSAIFRLVAITPLLFIHENFAHVAKRIY